MATQFTLNTINLRLSQSPEQLLCYGVAIYKDPSDNEYVAQVVEDEDGTHSYWVDPEGEVHSISDVTALRNAALLQSAKHGNLGKDAKGAKYSTATVTISTDSGQLIAVKAVYLPSESTPENDSFRFIGNPRNSRFAAVKFGVVK